ncbi:cytochrome c oxidase assembly protein, partial [Shewanella sp.]|uniref:cytochrome c oxidase assembly protein n=1 Tax=Shewanella sp. TaxID=50422 RepID=UPI00258E852C
LSVVVKPDERKMVVHPGDNITTLFYATNPGTESITIQAMPSITPGGAAKYFNKIECFCFTEQQLPPGETPGNRRAQDVFWDSLS